MTSPYNWLAVVVLVITAVYQLAIMGGKVGEDGAWGHGKSLGAGLTVASMLYVSCNTNLYNFIENNTRGGLYWVSQGVWRTVFFALACYGGVQVGGLLGELATKPQAQTRRTNPFDGK